VLQLPIWEEQESDRKESQESSDFSDICTMWLPCHSGNMNEYSRSLYTTAGCVSLKKKLRLTLWVHLFPLYIDIFTMLHALHFSHRTNYRRSRSTNIWWILFSYEKSRSHQTWKRK
jgi:hypothetical protein